MLIYDHWFHNLFIRQSSGYGEIEKYSQKDVYARIAYNSFCVYVCVCVCVCVLYLRIVACGFICDC